MMSNSIQVRVNCNSNSLILDVENMNARESVVISE